MWQLIFWHLSTVGNSLQFPGKPKFSVSFESDDENLIPLVNILNTLKNKDWDITILMKNTFSDLSLKERMEIISKIALKKASELIDV